MTPKQIAGQMALITLADLNNPEQAMAAVSMLKRLVPHMVEAMVGPVETAGMDERNIVTAYTQNIMLALFPDSADEVEDITDQDIADDDISDEEEVDADEESMVDGAKVEAPFLSSLAALKELAAGQVVRDKGKFLPLTDAEDDVGDNTDEEDPSKEVAAKPRNPKPKKALEAVTDGKVSKRRNVLGAA